MKTLRETPDELVLTSRPWFLGIVISACLLGTLGFGLSALGTGNGKDIFWGLFFIPLVLVLALVVFVRRDDLILDRSRSVVEFRHATFLGRKRQQWPLSDVERAIVQTSRSEDGKTHRVALVMQSGAHPVTPVYSGGKGAENAVAQINRWLANTVDSARPDA